MTNIGVSFDDIHSYHDLNLILSASDIPPAKPKTSYVDVPGADGSLDLTEAVGEVKYSDRDIRFTFTMLPDSVQTFEDKRTEVVNLLNGRVFKITLDRDEDYYFRGRCSVDSYDVDRNHHQIVISVKANPYKFKQNVTRKTIQLSETPQTVLMANGRKSVAPSITCTNNNTAVEFNGGVYRLSQGTHKVLDILFVEGNNKVTVYGLGSITFEYQEGEL